MRYEYEVIIDKIGTKAGHGKMTAHALTTHHTAVETRENGYDVISRLKAYVRHHNGVIAYHFYIPRDTSKKIYVTQYLTRYTWHNSNFTGNKDTLGICMEGNFQVQNPTETQLAKYRQLLDDIANNWFSKNGWVAFDKHINPRDKNTFKTYSGGKSVHILHYHNEIAQPGHGTACCGKNFIPKVLDYRNKQGNVSWGKISNPTPKPKPDPTPDPDKEKIADLEKQLAELQKQKETQLKQQAEEYNNKLDDLNSKIEQMEINHEEDRVKLLEEREKLLAEIDDLNELGKVELGVDLIKTQEVVANVIEETIEENNIIGKYYNFVDNKLVNLPLIKYLPDQVVRSLFKYDIFVGLGMLISYGLITYIPGLDISAEFKLYISFTLGTIQKILISRFDKNKDGQLTGDDLIVYNQYQN